MILNGISVNGRVRANLLVDNTNVTVLTHFNTNYTSTIGPSWTAFQTGGATVGISNSTYKFSPGSVQFTGNGVSSSYSQLSISDQSVVQFGSGDFTWEAFINPTSLSNAGTIFSKYLGGADNRVQANISTDGRLGFGIQNTASVTVFVQQTPASSIIVVAWQHVAFVRSGTIVTLYINGINLASAVSSFDMSTIGGPFALGTFINAAPPYRNGFDGYIDEVRLSKSAKYTGNFTPPSVPF